MATGPVVTLKKLWRQNRWLALAFIIALTLALVFIIRASIFFAYWQSHADEPIEGWMTVRYVARSYRVDPKIVHDAVGLPDSGPDRRPLIKIAREQGQPLDVLTARILDAIRLDRAAHALPGTSTTPSSAALPQATEPAKPQP
ncbi:hypothetical protein WNZ14_12295 [Hoeflea sp. AS60]|uniref:hypothetical protein n=1 Tax=Hoeflea sp. AS60 TaxID=3135780 RepID=UPI003179D993